MLMPMVPFFLLLALVCPGAALRMGRKNGPHHQPWNGTSPHCNRTSCFWSSAIEIASLAGVCLLMMIVHNAIASHSCTRAHSKTLGGIRLFAYVCPVLHRCIGTTHMQELFLSRPFRFLRYFPRWFFLSKSPDSARNGRFWGVTKKWNWFVFIFPFAVRKYLRISCSIIKLYHIASTSLRYGTDRKRSSAFWARGSAVRHSTICTDVVRCEPEILLEPPITVFYWATLRSANTISKGNCLTKYLRQDGINIDFLCRKGAMW